ncbi:alpha-amylase family glycosyl hydrolase [Psychroserpens sp. Hel_I_66]|uniref:alpha-amylase family glycosyl hydrolase n=1 Tax=Psychroserpens sp. Hel_I_66 TaxID=1250004 RepID=UPI0009DF54A2|nr:alpha-amylase family glycosyl hydrolase [Psychroserpens sp. Hel_I_66]
MKKAVLHIILFCVMISCNQEKEIDSKVIEKDENTSVYEPQDYVKLTHPEWSKNATIYQINTRQFSEEGTFKAAQKQLPRLKELGVDIIWLMPIHEIGEKNRKRTLGSPYAVKDYYSVNPEFGSLEDLKDFVNAAHEQNMYVIIDWVANHTAWDNVLVEKHPDWYQKDYKGDYMPTPWWDWSDIIDLDLSKPEVREYMTEAMTYWVKEAQIDGYRCNAAGFVPIEFWENAREELDKIKPVFMLAEWESRDLHANAFDMTYAWSWNEAMHQICMGEADVNKLYVYYSWNEKFFPENTMRMTFTSNHDMNAWEGTMFEQFGDGLEAAIALSVVGEGMPLIYNGQEAGNSKRLEFFEKDAIKWQEHAIGDLYKKLFALMKNNTALWHANWGARMIKIPNNFESEVLSFVRQNENDKVFAVFNFSNEKKSVEFKESLFFGDYKDFETNESVTLDNTSKMDLEPWDYKILVKTKDLK